VHCPHAGRSRREFVGLLGVGLLATLSGSLAGCASPGSSPSASGSDTPGPDPYFANPMSPGPPAAGPSGVDGPSEPDTIPPDPDGGRALGKSVITGKPQILHSGPAADRRIVLTVDDGFCADCVAGYVAFVKSSGIHMTFCPNGIYSTSWAPHAPVLRPLIEAGQIQLMNHTYDHKDLTVMTPAQIGADLDRNEDWIAKTFHTSTRPYFRPPFGRHTPQVSDAAAAVGYNVLTLWNGSYSDSTVITPDFLMSQARKYLQPGTITIGHANHPAVLGLFGQIVDLIKQRNLHPVTMDEMFGTRREPVTRVPAKH
jgi:peptidoglycan/xylan/chitin deacetylase (PgdA/CDA1 family)